MKLVLLGLALASAVAFGQVEPKEREAKPNKQRQEAPAKQKQSQQLEKGQPDSTKVAPENKKQVDTKAQSTSTRTGEKIDTGPQSTVNRTGENVNRANENVDVNRTVNTNRTVNKTVNVQEYRTRNAEVFRLGRHPRDYFVTRYGANHVRLIGSAYFAYVDGCWVSVDVDGFTYTERVICPGDPEFIEID